MGREGVVQTGTQSCRGLLRFRVPGLFLGPQKPPQIPNSARDANVIPKARVGAEFRTRRMSPSDQE